MKVFYKSMSLAYYDVIEPLINSQGYYKMIISKTDITDDTITINTTVFNFSLN